MENVGKRMAVYRGILMQIYSKKNICTLNWGTERLLENNKDVGDIVYKRRVLLENG